MDDLRLPRRVEDEFGAVQLANELAERAYQDELYDDLPCDSGCDVTSGAGVSVTIGETTAGIHFALYPESYIFADGFESGNTSGWSSTVP